MSQNEILGYAKIRPSIAQWLERLAVDNLSKAEIPLGLL